MPYAFLTRLHYTQEHILKVISTVSQTLRGKPPSSHYCPVRQVFFPMSSSKFVFWWKQSFISHFHSKPGRVPAMLVKGAFTPQMTDLHKWHKIIEIKHSPSVFTAAVTMHWDHSPPRQIFLIPELRVDSLHCHTMLWWWGADGSTVPSSW